ncbi:MAG TPA: glycosyltransferase [Patescibacteria group bacterium]
MKIALVHDYLNEFGGAERVLLALSEIWSEAPIYTAFVKKGSPAYERFKNKKIVTSWAQKVPGFNKYLFSPLRFLAPLIWNSFSSRLADYDVILASSGWYVTKGFKRGDKWDKSNKGNNRQIEICYCHTPPRWLYGYKTSIEWQRFWPIRIYGQVMAHFMRLYDFNAAQRVDYFIANSKEVQARIKKFYKRDSTVIYPPVDLPKSQKSKRKGYYLVVSRIVGAKGLSLAIEAANKLGIKLKIAGFPAGYQTEYKNLLEKSDSNIEFLGYVSDEELTSLYEGAKAFLALAKDEDFGITPVEAMSFGTPVVAYYGGGYKETVIDGKTGVFFKDYSVEGLIEAISKLDRIKIKSEDCLKQAEKFNIRRFQKEIQKFVEEKMNDTRK